MDRKQFANADPGVSIRVTGRFQEGGSSQFGFGGFGGGPNRSVIGAVRLAKSGIKPGDKIAGTIDVKIVETRGGFFNQRRPPGGFQSPRPGGMSGGPSTMQPLTLQQALDMDRDGQISSDEMQQSDEVFKRLDRNGDGKLSGNELQNQPNRPELPSRRRPVMRRPQMEENLEADSSSRGR
ncbi:MAG: hypothetical protein HKN47_11985 [Pirellulaceae bacterium]|nr:hypothetical protein [Pirellulaceae bacterium]